MPKPRKPAPKRKPIAKPSHREKQAAQPARKPRTPPPPPPAPPPGKPPYVPSDQDRAMVRYLLAGGYVQEKICALLGISRKTFRGAFRDAIAAGQMRVDAISISTLVKAMTAGGKSAVNAAIWWQKARMRWTDGEPDDGKPPNVPMRVIIELVGDAPKTIEHEGRPRPGFDAAKHVEFVG